MHIRTASLKYQDGEFSVSLQDAERNHAECRSLARQFRNGRECPVLLEEDRPFDLCLMVRDRRHGAGIACMPVTTASRAMRNGGFEAETRFDLSGLRVDHGACMELGSPLILADHAADRIMRLLVAALRSLVAGTRCEGFFTRIRLPLSGGDRFVQTLVHSLRRSRYALPEELVRPRVRLGRTDMCLRDEVVLPAVLHSYLQLGARVCSEPYWDAEEGTAEILLWLGRDRLSGRDRLRCRDRVPDGAGCYY